MGLGSLHAVTLTDARENAFNSRRLLQDGIDPIDARSAARLSQRLAAARTKTFDECTTAYIKAKRVAWKNPKHASQWENTLAAYASPTIGRLAVRSVDTAFVVSVLEPPWQLLPETASRLRGRIEAVLDWAAVHKWEGENPARRRGTSTRSCPRVRR